MSKNAKTIVICLLVSIIIGVFPLLYIKDSEFGGADGAAEEAISKVNEDYEAWYEPIIELPGGETESLLFSLQAALGSGVFAYGMGYMVARKKFKKENEKENMKSNVNN